MGRSFAKERYILSMLSAFYTEEEARRWMVLPHPQLDGKSAAEAIAAGRYEDVVAIVKRLEADAYL